MNIRQPSATAANAPHLPAGTLLQRKCACGNHTSGAEECEECKRKRLQRRAASADEDEFDIPPIVGTVLSSPGRPLDRHAREKMEAGFGHDFHDVRIHTDVVAQRSARSVNALAYTVGRNVVFGSGQYAPGSHRGMHLLAHELAHVVQQRGHAGGVRGTGRSDATLERDADRAADRVVRGDRGTPPTAAAPRAMLARQAVPAESSTRRIPGPCHGRLDDLFRPPPIRWGSAPTGRYAISRVESAGRNRKRVVLDTGQRYIVERTAWTRSGTGPATRTDLDAGADREQVWVEFRWCRGSNEATVRAGANVPEAALRLIRDAIANGGDIEAAWASATATPSVAGTFRLGTVELTVSGNATIGTDGNVRGGSGTISGSGDTSAGRVGGSVTAGSDPSTGPFVTANIEFRWGAAPRSPPRCEEQWTRSGYSYFCYEERDVPSHTRTGERRVTVLDERAYNLFFLYDRVDFDDIRNQEALQALQQDLGAGFQVQSIEGWTSPEGTTDPDLRPGSQFGGNQALSVGRANAARDRVNNELCPPDTACIAPGARIEGMGERMDPMDPVSGERLDTRGAALEQHVDTHFADDPAEASVRSPALMERLRRTPSRRRRAELIYPWLRRAILRLRRSAASTEACEYEVPARAEERGIGNCPDDIRRAAYPDRRGGP